ncbi:hypothetical protein MTR67_002174 [Solanum verrucosum]|uniref:Uncharacterized protein n=1 Tax=Solanum verrucosum TaxID=315347 RepID=A0AAF0PPK6_SOLVR|nr:hypothetical protein MTR67_002174 [Solanum verrucosum]
MNLWFIVMLPELA